MSQCTTKLSICRSHEFVTFKNILQVIVANYFKPRFKHTITAQRFTNTASYQLFLMDSFSTFYVLQITKPDMYSN